MCPICLHSAREDHSLLEFYVSNLHCAREDHSLSQFYVSNPSALCTRRPLSVKSSMCPIHLHSAREDHSLSEFYVSNLHCAREDHALSRVLCVQSICTLHEKTTLSLTADSFKAYLVHSSKCIQKPLFRKVIEII